MGHSTQPCKYSLTKVVGGVSPLPHHFTLIHHFIYTAVDPHNCNYILQVPRILINKDSFHPTNYNNKLNLDSIFILIKAFVFFFF